MTRAAGVALLLSTLALITVRAEGADEKDNRGKKLAEVATNRDLKILAQAGTVVGKVVRASGTDRSLTLRLEFPALKASPGGNRRGGGKRVVTNAQDFPLQGAADVVVRANTPPAEFDDKGYPKKYTAEELRKLKGTNSNLPGYALEFDQLRPGDLVKVTFKKPTASEKKDDAAEKGPVLSRIILLQAGADPVLAKGGGKPSPKK